MKKKIIVVAGPTAVGKSKYAIELAKKYNGEIISLDSVQIYKGLDIGSAKIRNDEMEGIPHYMIDEVEPDIDLNVKDFKDMAIRYMNMIFDKGKTPILVGGTGFYIRAILYDTDFLYEDEEKAREVRDKLYKELEAQGIETLYERLKNVDFESTKTIPLGNKRRIIRALEFYELHGFPISKHNKEERLKESNYDFDFYILDMDREKLYARINARVDHMIESGLLDEVKTLIEKGISKTHNSMKSIGYSELYDFCKACDDVKDIDSFNEEKKIELKKIIEDIKQHTRNYAKRQLTWFRREKNTKWIVIK